MGDTAKRGRGGAKKDRKADALAGKDSFAEMLEKKRKAKERGDLIRAREIGQEYQRRKQRKRGD